MEWDLSFRDACKLEDIWFSPEAVCPVVIVEAEEPYYRAEEEVGAKQLGELLEGFGIWFAQPFKSCRFHGFGSGDGKQGER